MTAVEVLAPLRLETRFVSPADREDGVDEWRLRLRIYPDEFSILRGVAAPSAMELDRLADAAASLTADPRIDKAAAFASLAAAVGANRAMWLWRTALAGDEASGWRVDRSGEATRTTITTHAPVGLPETLEVWLVLADGTRKLADTLELDLDAIGADLDVAVFDESARVAEGELPNTWWLSYPRAVTVGLGVDLDIGSTPPQLDALVVVGVGNTPAADLVDAHNAAGRLAVLATGTPTNTVEGEPTADLGDDPDSWFALLDVKASEQRATPAVLTALTGRVPAAAFPMLGGDLDYFGPGALAVEAFWPVLWGRAMRDVIGAGEIELDLAHWARWYLAVEGARPAIRVGEQPYGLLPTSAFENWLDDPDSPAELIAVEPRIRRWGLAWRGGAAAAARTAANGWLRLADTAALLEVIGLNAPSRRWRVRPVVDLHVIQAMRALAGMPLMDASDWDRATALSWTDRPYPQSPIGAAGGRGTLPGPPLDTSDDAHVLATLCTMSAESLYDMPPRPLGLVGHLFRESLLTARAIMGEAITHWRTHGSVQLGQSMPLDEEAFRDHVMQGDDGAIEELSDQTDANGRLLAERFDAVRGALRVIADLWEREHNQLFNGVLAALDTAAFRVDPWLTGLAERRLQQFTEAGAPFLLGAYGWVDAPAPYTGEASGPLAPGPTAAGLLHAPSHTQALTAALLRDASVRYPDENRWRLQVDSAKVRAAAALSERVRLGVHPYEALGLEVERIAGEWDTVRVLRREYPLAADQQLRRVCDGAQVLRAAREAKLPADLPPDLAARLAALDDVLDTYADLLVADGIHALVSGHADLGNAAMEAAAGLGAPPELRAIRTPRAATTVRVSAWVLLPPGAPGNGAALDPTTVADPAFASLVAAEGLDQDAVTRLAAVLGGGEDDPPVPSLTGGDHEVTRAREADAALQAAMESDLRTRLQLLVDRARATGDQLGSIDADAPDAAATVRALTLEWGFSANEALPADLLGDPEPAADALRTGAARELGERIDSAVDADSPAATVNTLRQAIRLLVGRRDLPVLPIVDRSLLPAMRVAPNMDRMWLEIVAAVRPRLAPLEARQLDPALPVWPAAIAAPDGSTDPWHSSGPVVIAYGPAAPLGGGKVAVAALDAWTDSVPSRRHTTTAAFGFNAPKSRAPQAILLAVPPDTTQRLSNPVLLDVVLGTRELAHARGARPSDRDGLPYATPAPLVHLADPVNFLEGWPS